MSEENDIQHKLEENVGRVQDGVDSLRHKLSDTVDDLACNKGCAALDAVRDCVVDQPVVSVVAAGFIGFVLGAVLARKV
ncbi:hypothetical protein LHT11_02805 [Acetobacter indonesiensis]|uniref:hypothetical protein n=1 Tax=Acetobacter indonesiensis TaxID=104101 RepID=UPI001F32A86A|nr:hypothetical protein [Acetobacter indonesiensis]MCG0994131.1 hypothetical protein [Acetobacter indonesiensis]